MALVSTGFHAIKDICGRRENWRLKVKLVRCWNMCAVATPNDPYAMKMLFIDEKGGTIEATVQKHYMHRFTNHVVEGKVYKIINFTVNRNGGKFRACSHDYKLSFSASTRVVLCERTVIPFMGLSLLKSNEIKDTRGFSQTLFEFMGIVTSVSEEMMLTREGMDTRLILLDLVDEMGPIRCAIFGDLVDTVHGFMALPRHGLLVMIIQLARVNLYKGEVGIQNLMNASKLLWNPDIPEAISFKESLFLQPAVQEVEFDVAISVVPEKYRPVSLRDQFLKKLYPNKTVGELIELVEDGDFILLGTITEILEGGTWWYHACTCMRAVNFDGGPPYCDECQMEVYDMSPRYKVKLVVSDGNQSVSLILFDFECYYLLRRHCKDLLAEHKAKKQGGYPPEILNFVGRELLFRVDRKEDDFFLYDECHRVRKLCSDTSIINDFKEMVADDTPLKLKFSPAFSKLDHSEAQSCVIDLSPQCNSVGSEVGPTPPSTGQSLASNGSLIIASKRGSEEAVDPPCDKQKRTRLRSVKLERG